MNPNLLECKYKNDLLKSDWILYKVYGDGRCLFRCLVLACEETSSDKPLSSNRNLKSNEACDKLRRDTIAVLEYEQDELEKKSVDLPFILDNRIGEPYQSVQERLTQMSNRSTYAGYLEILAAACLLKRQIWTYRDKGDNKFLKLWTKLPTEDFEDHPPPIHLLYTVDTETNAGHFDLLGDHKHQMQWSWSTDAFGCKISKMIDPSSDYMIKVRLLWFGICSFFNIKLNDKVTITGGKFRNDN